MQSRTGILHKAVGGPGLPGQCPCGEQMHLLYRIWCSPARARMGFVFLTLPLVWRGHTLWQCCVDNEQGQDCCVEFGSLINRAPPPGKPVPPLGCSRGQDQQPLNPPGALVQTRGFFGKEHFYIKIKLVHFRVESISCKGGNVGFHPNSACASLSGLCLGSCGKTQ